MTPCILTTWENWRLTRAEAVKAVSPALIFFGLVIALLASAVAAGVAW